MPIIPKVMIMANKCTYCGYKLDKKWNYCPHCGKQVDKRVTMFSLLKRQMDIIRNLMLGDEYRPNVQRSRNAITIRIDSRGFGEPHIHVLSKPFRTEQNEPYQTRKQRRRLVGKIIEPEVNVKRLAKEMIITIPLPGVKSEKDIELNRLENSIELRAFAGDRGYFKILNIPKSHKLIERSLNNSKLNLRFVI